MKYSDKCSGLVSWFDCYFTHGIDHVILPTSKIYKLRSIYVVNSLEANNILF